MKLKLSILASALALAVAGQASATTTDMLATGGSDLVLTVWDQTATTSFTEDLGINMQSFVNGTYGTVTGTVMNQTATQTNPLTISANSTLSSYLSGLTSGDTVVWNVTAGKASGSGFNGFQFLTTTQATAATVAGQQNSPLKNFQTANQYYDGSGALNGGTSVVNSAAGNPAGYAGAAQFGTQFGGTNAVFNTTAALGQSQNFFYLTPSSLSATAHASTAQFLGTVATLDNSGNLLITAVPEPGEWLMMLSGFGLIGFVAARRKSQGSSLTFA